MKFGAVPLEDAAGSILAHSQKLGDRRLKKGTILTQQDIDALRHAGVTEIVVASPGAGDILEDEAAGLIARALLPDSARQGIWCSAPFTGRANVYAETSGILRVNSEVVRQINDIDESVTLATLPDFTRVTRRQMIGTVKIIPYGAPMHAIASAESVLKGKTALHVEGLRLSTAQLILTQTPGMKDSVVKKGATAVQSRLAALGVDLVSEVVVPHTADALSSALTDHSAEMVLILTGSATSDRGDVGPQALVDAGGTLTRFGMPVDPGNLLFLGRLGEVPVIGLPGCARSLKLNGADWVIERVACGMRISSEDIAAMGVGGLLKEIPSRPEPRHGGASAPKRPVIAAILLAAGSSSRMRGRDKLMEVVDGAPLIRRVASALSSSSIDKIYCITRTGQDARWMALDGMEIERVENPRSAEGMATSIAAGIAALDDHVDGVVIMMADMPDVSASDFDRLLAGFDPGEGRAIIRAVTKDGLTGHPVLFGRRFFEALRTLDGDVGAKAVVMEHPEFVTDVVLSDRRALTDLDTPEDWDAWRKKRSG